MVDQKEDALTGNIYILHHVKVRHVNQPSERKGSNGCEKWDCLREKRKSAFEEEPFPRKRSNDQFYCSRKNEDSFLLFFCFSSFSFVSDVELKNPTCQKRGRLQYFVSFFVTTSLLCNSNCFFFVCLNFFYLLSFCFYFGLFVLSSNYLFYLSVFLSFYVFPFPSFYFPFCFFFYFFLLAY